METHQLQIILRPLKVINSPRVCETTKYELKRSEARRRYVGAKSTAHESPTLVQPNY